jgi:hypothetical protein
MISQNERSERKMAIHRHDVTAAINPVRGAVQELERKLAALADAPISEHPHYAEELQAVDSLLTFLGATSDGLKQLRDKLAEKFGC